MKRGNCDADRFFARNAGNLTLTLISPRSSAERLAD